MLPKISSELPDLVAAYITTRGQRLEMEKDIEPIKEHEELLKKAIIAKYQEQGLTALGTPVGTVKMKEAEEPDPTDWIALWDHIKQTGDFSLLHKRVTAAAVKERWELGKEVPGVGRKTVYTLSVSKA